MMTAPGRAPTLFPCGMCSRICWQCEQQHERLKAEFERQEERVAALEIAFIEAGDDDRDEISQRLQDAIEVWWEMGEEIERTEGGP